MSRFGNWVILDDVFIVERALSASEVAIVHKLGIGGTATPVDPKGKVSTYWPEINLLLIYTKSSILWRFYRHNIDQFLSEKSNY